MLKIISVYINSASDNPFPSPTYLDELRPKIPRLQNEVTNLTFLNPGADRAQMLLEYYEAHIEYQYAKVELVNTYMEAYEHIVDPKKSVELIQTISNIINFKPVLDLNVMLLTRTSTLASRT
jgi:hypothetical protein